MHFALVLTPTSQAGLSIAAAGQVVTPVYWATARAAGIVAYILLTISMASGMLISTQVLDKVVSRKWSYALHKFITTVMLFFVAAHLAFLLLDAYTKFTVPQLLVPFTSAYRPWWTGWGIVAMYGIVALVVSSYAQKQIGQKVWRGIHYSSFGVFGLVTLHGLGDGTDANSPLLRLMYLGAIAVVVSLIAFRMYVTSQTEATKVPAGRAGGVPARQAGRAPAGQTGRVPARQAVRAPAGRTSGVPASHNARLKKSEV